MKVTVYSTHFFEKEYLQKANKDQHELLFIDAKLNTPTAQLARGGVSGSKHFCFR